MRKVYENGTVEDRILTTDHVSVWRIQHPYPYERTVYCVRANQIGRACYKPTLEKAWEALEEDLKPRVQTEPGLDLDEIRAVMARFLADGGVAFTTGYWGEPGGRRKLTRTERPPARGTA